MEQALFQLAAAAKAALELATDVAQLQALKVRFLGKKGELTAVLQSVGQLPANERPRLGQVVNQVKQDLQACFDQREQVLEAAALSASMDRGAVDITLHGRRLSESGSLHPVTQIKNRVLDIFSTMGFIMEDGPEIEDEYHNFTALNIPTTHPARASHDTFYFNDGRLLRTHTSPVQIRAIQARGVPIRLMTAGRVYRCDSDQTHTPMFHQFEGLLIDQHVCFSDLKGMLHDFLQIFFNKPLRIRFRPGFFPFTEPSAEVDIYDARRASWLEILGCGMVHPAVLAHMGVDPDVYSGYACGMGLDRLAMLHYDIPDLRFLFENDIRFLSQFSSLYAVQ